MKTSPLSRKSWSFSSASSTSASDPGVFFTLALSAPCSSYRSLSIGFGGSVFFLMPSSPAISSAANTRYGFDDGSGARNSRRFALGDWEYMGIRTIAERLRAE